MTTTNPSSTGDLLKIFDSFSIPKEKENVIPEQDLKFCERQQELLYKTLDRIQLWYGIFHKEASGYAESLAIAYKEDGTLTYRDCHMYSKSDSPDYKQFEFKPFEIINSLVKNRKSAVRAFADNIVRYFNNRYSISVPFPEIDDDNLTLDFHPAYTDYTSLVEQHLQGRGFRETAEEELIRRTHALVQPCRSRKLPELRSDKIVFQNLIHIEETYPGSNVYRVEYSYGKKLDVLCEGILFSNSMLLNGSSIIIRDFNYMDVDITRWYSLTFATGYEIKFYKNGRIDVRFPDTGKAKTCFERLRLNNIENLIGQ